MIWTILFRKHNADSGQLISVIGDKCLTASIDRRRFYVKLSTELRFSSIESLNLSHFWSISLSVLLSVFTKSDAELSILEVSDCKIQSYCSGFGIFIGFANIMKKLVLEPLRHWISNVNERKTKILKFHSKGMFWI